MIIVGSHQVEQAGRDPLIRIYAKVIKKNIQRKTFLRIFFELHRFLSH